jgi:chemotaxis response regulator CheB
VDDSDVVRHRLCELLIEDSCVSKVSEAVNSAEAWNLFEQIAPDVVLLEVCLADGRGL